MTTLFPVEPAMRATCIHCGRELTDPESIRKGAGPVCCPSQPKPPRVDHPVLPGISKPREPVAEACPSEAVVVLRFRGLEVRYEALDDDNETAINAAVAAWVARRTATRVAKEG